MVRYWRGGLGEAKIDNPRTIASAIRIGKPVNWFRLIEPLSTVMARSLRLVMMKY